MLVDRLIWDAWNVAHIARHGVTPEEVEEVCQATAQAEAANKGRLRLTGETSTRRLISLFLDPEPTVGTYYVVTARDASKNERRAYKAWASGKEQAA